MYNSERERRKITVGRLEGMKMEELRMDVKNVVLQ